MAHENLPTEFTQPFGILHHVRCLNPLMYVVTEDPETIAKGMGRLLKKYLDTTYISGPEGLCAMASRRAMQRGDENPPRQPILSTDEPAKTLTEVQKRACRDDIYTLVVLNPEAWLTQEGVVANLLEWAKVRDERQAMMVMLVGPSSLKVPEALKPYMPRIEGGFSLDKPNPLPRDAGTSLEDVTKIVATVLGKLRMDKAAAPVIAERLVGFDAPLIDIAMAQCIIYGKRMMENRDAILQEPGKVLDEVFDGWERINGWPV